MTFDQKTLTPTTAAASIEKANVALAATSPGNAIEARRLPEANALLEAFGEAVVLVDAENTIRFANAAACRLFSVDTVSGRPIRALCHGLPDDYFHHVACLCADRGRSIAKAMLGDDEGRAAIELHARLTETADAVFAVCIVRAAERPAEEDAYKAIAERYRTMLRVIDEAIIIRDVNGRIMFANAAAYRLLKLDHAQLMAAEKEGFAGWSFTNGAGAPLSHAELPSLQTLRTREANKSDLLCIWLPHAKQHVWATISTMPFFRQPGDAVPYAVMSISTDVTEMKMMRDLLAQTQSIGHIGGYELRLDDCRLRWTDEMYRLFDLPTDAVIGLHVLESALTPPSRERMWEQIAAATRGKNGEDEYEFVTVQGNRRWISVKSEPIQQAGTVVGITGTCQEITERKRLENELRKKASTDAMTGLVNRERILAELDGQAALASGDSRPSLIYVDLDRFKVISDLLGARAGDKLIADVAQRLATCVPDNALCGRFSGEEFLIALPATISNEGAGEIAELIRARLSRPFVHAQQKVSITASIGVARLALDEKTAESLLQRATAAMLDARRSGGGTWRFYSASVDRRSRDAKATVADLQDALRRHELRLVYQPQIALESGDVVSAEALLRWDHPSLGELPAQAFLRHAEDSGEIVAIGAWVVDEACRQLRLWRDHGLHIERVAINVAYRQMLSESLHGIVSIALQRHGLPGSSLEIETIERVLLEGTPEILDMFRHLRDLGVSITLDDFGEGYSSLNYLRRLPIDGFKIGYDFMRRVPISSSDTALCKAMIEVGHALGIGMSAAGVESEQQLEFLRLQRMPIVQGHWLSKALDPSSFATFAHTQRQRSRVHETRNPDNRSVGHVEHSA